MKNAPGSLIEAKQYANEGPISGDGIELPVEQVLHLTWDAPSFSPRVNSLVFPAYQSIELLRDYRRAEQAIAKRWATPFRLEGVGVDASGGAVVGGLRGTRGAGEGEGVFDEEAVSGDDRERCAMRLVSVVSVAELMSVRAVGPAGGATMGAEAGRAAPMAC